MSNTQINPFGKRMKLRNNEYQTYCTEVQSAINKAGVDAEHLNCEAVAQVFDQALAAYADAIVVVSKSALTQQLDEADRERDDVFMGLMDHIRSSAKHYKTEMRAAAAALMPTVDTYTGIQKKPAADETSYLNNFIADLQADKFAAQRATLGIDEWLAQLQAANEKYIDLSEQRTADQSGITIGASKTTRAALDDAYSNLVQMLNALCLVFGEAKYADTFAYINTRIKYYEDLLAQRAGVADAKEEPTEA